MPHPAPPSTPPRSIVIVAFDGVQALDVTGPADVFAKAERCRAGSYGVVLAAPGGGRVVTNSGLVLAECLALEDVPRDSDTILIAGGDEPGLRRAILEHGLAAWIEGRAASTRRVASVCTGAFVLGAAGLLDGRRATTHWDACGRLRAMFPRARITRDILFTADPPVYTSAGVAAGIDLALVLVEEDFGPARAFEVARSLVVAVRRSGAEPQMGAALSAQAHASRRLSALLAWIADNPAADLGVGTLAARYGASERQFSRSFHRQTGVTPARFVEHSRIEQACRLLAGSDWPLDRIADRCGFGSTDALHRAFRRRFGTSPAAWRRVGPSPDQES